MSLGAECPFSVFISDGKHLFPLPFADFAVKKQSRQIAFTYKDLLKAADFKEF